MELNLGVSRPAAETIADDLVAEEPSPEAVAQAAGGPRVAVVAGSRSDLDVMEKAVALLARLEIRAELRVISAHRAPELLERYVTAAPARGIEIFIAGAGLAAHLPGVIASRTTLPVIGVPLAGGSLGGLDALLSVVQMPRGVPVATVGVGMAENAALLAAQILSLGDAQLAQRLGAYRQQQTQAILDEFGTAEAADAPEA